MVTRHSRSILNPAAILGLATALLASTACGGGPSTADCEKVVRHIVDLEAAEAGAAATQPAQKAELEQRKKAVFQSVGTRYCLDEMPVAQVECALKARTLAELATTCDKT
jgi:hypothetical protein